MALAIVLLQKDTELLYIGYSGRCGQEVYAILCSQVHLFMPKNQVLLPLLPMCFHQFPLYVEFQPPFNIQLNYHFPLEAFHNNFPSYAEKDL